MIKNSKKLIHTLNSDDVPSIDILIPGSVPTAVPEASWIELNSAKNCRKVSLLFANNTCDVTIICNTMMNVIGVSNGEGRGGNERFRDARQ